MAIFLPPFYQKDILTLPSHLCLGLSSGLLPLGFLTKFSYAFSSLIRAACFDRLILLDLIGLIFGEDYKL
jgi:hypothetical protein